MTGLEGFLIALGEQARWHEARRARRRTKFLGRPATDLRCYAPCAFCGGNTIPVGRLADAVAGLGLHPYGHDVETAEMLADLSGRGQRQ